MNKVCLGLLLTAGCMVNAAEQSNGAQVKQILPAAPSLSDVELKKEASVFKEDDSSLTYEEVEAIDEIDQKLVDALMQKESRSATIGAWKKVVESADAEKFVEILAYLRVHSGDAGCKRLAQIDKEVAHRIYTRPLDLDICYSFGVKKADKYVLADVRFHSCEPNRKQFGRRCTVRIWKKSEGLWTSKPFELRTRDGKTFINGKGLVEFLKDSR